MAWPAYLHQKPLLTPKQHAFFMEHQKGRTRQELADMMNARFGLNLTTRQIHNYRNNNHLPSSGLTGRFQKGYIPWNKGLHYQAGGRCAETQFKKGNVPHNHKSVGTERVTKEGYVEVKVAEPNKWRGKHVVVWESLHGPRPRGYKIIFADGNRRNFDPENLLLVSSAELVRMNQNGWVFDDAELTKTGAAIAKLKCLAAERKRKKKPKPEPQIIHYDPKTLKIL